MTLCPFRLSAPLFNVMDYGAHADGTTDDVAHIQDAITAAAGGIVYFPAGTYAIASALTVPDGTKLRGVSMTSAWLAGRVDYGSTSTFTDLKIGNSGATGCSNAAGASTTSFTRCHFRGGTPGVASYQYVLQFGYGNSCDHLTFTDCEIERNLCDSENNLGWNENVNSLGGAHMEYITFTGCHFGVTNGRTDIARNIGAPRANVELYQTPEGGVVRTGWHNIGFYDCIMEAADWFTLDIPGAIYGGAHTDGYITIDGCTIYGGGVAKSSFPNGIVIEGVNHVTINDCDIYPAYDFCLSILTFGGVDTHDWEITNNRFHLDDFTNSGIDARHAGKEAVRLQGTGVYTGNTLHNSTGSYYLLWVGDMYEGYWADGCTITGNEFHELRTGAPDTGMVGFMNATDNIMIGNTFQTAYTADPTFDYISGNSGNTVTPNTLIHA